MEANELARTAERRLNPPLTDPNYLVLRARRRIFEAWLSELGDGVLVLDVGGRYQPYRPLVKNPGRYVAVDVQKTPLVDVVGDGQRLPFAPAAFDLVISTQVFDCFADPRRGAVEVLRVLKPGGVFIMSVPAFAPRFADIEQWRFMPTGIRSTLSGFTEIEIVPEVSSLGGLVRSCNLGAHALLGKSRALQAVYEWTICPVLNLAGRALEAMKLTRSDQFTANYSVRARRPRES